MELKITFRNRQEFLEKASELFLMVFSDNKSKLDEFLLENYKPKNDTEKENLEKAKATKKAKPAEKTEPEPQPEPQPEPPPELQPEPEQPRKVTSIDELRAAFVAKNAPENRAKLKAILTELGVNKITELQEAQWDEAFTRLEAI